MKLEDILHMKIDDNESLTKLQKAVLKTKWFRRFEADELTLEVLEEGYKKVIKKYPVRIAYINSASEKAWSFMIKEVVEHQHIYTIIARTLYEGMCKSILVLYGYIELDKMFSSERKVDLWK